MKEKQEEIQADIVSLEAWPTKSPSLNIEISVNGKKLEQVTHVQVQMVNTEKNNDVIQGMGR